MATQNVYYGRDKNYSGSVSRWLRYLKKGNKANSIFQQGITELNKILDDQIDFAKSREAKFKEEVKFMNDFFEDMNDETKVEKDVFYTVIEKANELTANPDRLFKEIENSTQYLTEIGILDVEGEKLLASYINNNASKSGVKIDKLVKFMEKITSAFGETYDAQQHYKMLSILGFAKEQYLAHKLEEYLQKYIKFNANKLINNSVQIIQDGTNLEKSDVSISVNNNDGTSDKFGISSKLANETRFTTSGIKFHSKTNSPFTLQKIFDVYNIKNYQLRRLLIGFIYHSGARMTKKNKKGETENIKYQQWYEYNKEFANKLASILASAAIGDKNTVLFSDNLSGYNQVDFLYLGNKIIPKSSVLMTLRNDNIKTQVQTQFYVSKFSRNFIANNHSFGYYAKKGEIGKDNSEVEKVAEQLLEKSGLRGIRIKYKIKKEA